MAFILKDRVKENTTSTGTGAVSLSGAASTFDTFQSYMVNGDTTYYAIVSTASGVDEWEVGLGTWNTGNTLTRTTVLAGSNGTSTENFSAGPKDVFMTYPAAHAALAGDDVDFANITVTGTVDGRDVAADGTKLDTVEQNADVTDAINVAAAGALMKSGGTMTGNLILNGDPTVALGAATKEYVDTIAAAGIHYHTPVRVEAPLNLTVTYNNGTAGVGATLTNAGTQEAITIDGVALSSGDRVLVYEQTDATQNGIYTVTTVGDGSTNWVLTRATDADSYGVSDPDAFGEGDAFFVKEGATGAGELYVMNTSGTITFGTTNITFTVIAETAVYSAGTGLTLTGTTFAIGQDVGTTANVTFNQVTAAIIGNVTGNVTGNLTGNADTASALETARTVQLSGDVTGSATFDGSANINITASVQDDSHAHVISNVDGLQTALDAKADDSTTITAGSGLTGGGSIGVNRTISHADTSTQASLTALTGAAVVSDVDVDTYGHVTGLATRNMTLADLGYTGETDATADQTITAGSGLSGGGTGNVTLSHSDTSSQASVNNSNGTVIQDITLDTYGHITGINSANLDGRYYTESEADSRFVNVAGDTMSGRLTMFTSNVQAPSASDATTGARLVLFPLGSGRDYAIGIENSTMWFNSDDHYKWYVDGSKKFEWDNSLNNLKVGSNNVFHDGYHPNADKWTTARTLSLSGDASGSVSWDGSSNATLSVTVADNSHSHSNYFPWFRGGSYNINTELGSGVYQGSTGGWSNRGPSGNNAGALLNINTHSGAYYSQLWFDTANSNFYHRSANNDTTPSAAWDKVWTSGNDGSGSGLDADLLDGVQGSSFLRSDASDVITGDNRSLSFGTPGAGATTGARWLSIEGNSDGSGEGSGRLFFTEHNSTTTAMDNYGFSIGYRGGDTNVVGASGNTWTGLTQIGNGEWGMWGHDNNGPGALIMHGDRAGTYVDFSGNNIQGVNDLYVADQIIHTGDTNTYMQFHAADQWRVVTGGAERLEVNNINTSLATNLQITSHVINMDLNNIADNAIEMEDVRSSTWPLNFTTNAVGNDNESGFWVGSNGYPDMRLRRENGTVRAMISSWEESFVSNGFRVEGNFTADNATFDNGTSTTLSVKCDDAGLAMVRANGDSRGTGALEVGQSNSYGGGISYNGDNSPSFVSGETADAITFYRMEASTRTEVFSYPYNSNRVTFNEVPYVGGSNVWHAGNDGAGSGLDADLLDGLHESTFMRKSANSSLDMNNNNITDVEDIYLQDKIYHDGDTNTYIQFHAADQFRVVTGGTERLEVNNSRTQIDNLEVTGTATFSGTVTGSAVTAYNKVGTYAALFPTTNASRSPGDTLGGSSLRATAFFSYGGTAYGPFTPSGTWRCMGSTGYYNGSALNQNDKQSTLWVRIS